MSLLEITGLTHSYGERFLYKNAGFSLYKGEHVGVVGTNGAGKSTLIKICTGLVVPDEGHIQWQAGVNIGYLDQYAAVDANQTIFNFLRSAFYHLYELEAKMNAYYTSWGTGNVEALELASACQSELEAKDFYLLDTKINQVANGLGLSAIGLHKKIAHISGGQRAKVILGKLLLSEADVLLLDEPTNFLDKGHIEWLSGYLASAAVSFLVVSHDYGFLEAISDHICDVGQQGIQKYAGRYTDYLKQKAQLQEDYARRYQAQQKHIKETEAFIRKNIAGQNSKNAKGRRKQLERIERLDAPEHNVAKPTFSFPATGAVSSKIEAFDLQIGYTSPLLPKLSFVIEGGQKVVVTGFNGIGKSTLIQTIIGALPALGGVLRREGIQAVGYYAQDFIWPDGRQTPLQLVQAFNPRMSDRQARSQLAHCGISVQHAMQPVGSLSGGEQAKTKLCLLTLKQSDILVFDEPTNHLDANAKQALRVALETFPGTVLLVSHEEAFYKDWTDQIMDIEACKAINYEEACR